LRGHQAIGAQSQAGFVLEELVENALESLVVGWLLSQPFSRTNV
jgi:hypothetical protein